MTLASLRAGTMSETNGQLDGQAGRLARPAARVGERATQDAAAVPRQPRDVGDGHGDAELEGARRDGDGDRQPRDDGGGDQEGGGEGPSRHRATAGDGACDGAAARAGSGRSGVPGDVASSTALAGDRVDWSCR